MLSRYFPFLLIVLVTYEFIPVAAFAELVNEPMNEFGFNILSAINCGEIRGNKVAYGNKTSLNEFPFLALLKYDASDDIFKCGGSLISNRYVLSAAHCWVGQDIEPTAVRLGEYDYSLPKDCMRKGKHEFCNPPVEDFGIDKLIAHPLYKYNEIHHDIGLIRLDREVSFKIHIKPVCLPIHKDSQLLDSDQRYIVAGWGATENDFKSTVLLKAVVPHRTNDYCQNIFTTYQFTDNHICAGGGDDRVNSCQGDSGGPLFFQSPYNNIPKYVQFGVSSHGYGIDTGGTVTTNVCGLKTYPNVYTKVLSYLPWITKVIAQYES